MKRRVFSGIQPSEVIHIGNYIGAVKRWLALQNDPAKDAILYVKIFFTFPKTLGCASDSSGSLEVKS